MSWVVEECASPWQGGQTTHRMRAHVHGTDALVPPWQPLVVVRASVVVAESAVVDRHATIVVVRAMAGAGGHENLGRVCKLSTLHQPRNGITHRRRRRFTPRARREQDRIAVNACREIRRKSPSQLLLVYLN